jgi:hypothetical protein
MHLRTLVPVAAIAAAILAVPNTSAADRLPMPKARWAMLQYMQAWSPSPEDSYSISKCRRRSSVIVWCASRSRYPASWDEPGAEGWFIAWTRIVARQRSGCVRVHEVAFEHLYDRCVPPTGLPQVALASLAKG